MLNKNWGSCPSVNESMIGIGMHWMPLIICNFKSECQINLKLRNKISVLPTLSH